MKRKDIKVGDRLNYIAPDDIHGRDNEVIALSELPWKVYVGDDGPGSVTIIIDGEERIIPLHRDGAVRPAASGNGVLVVFADHLLRRGFNPNPAEGFVVQLRYLHPWTEENEAKAVAERELDKQIRQARMRAFRESMRA
jgi:hypothetical protein